MKKYLQTRAKIEKTVNYWRIKEEEAQQSINELLKNKFNERTWETYQYLSAERCNSILIVYDLKEILQVLDDEFETPFET